MDQDESEAEIPEPPKDSTSGCGKEAKPGCAKEAKPGCAKEPFWPLVVGSVVPALAVIGYFYLLWTVTFGQSIQVQVPYFSANLPKVLSTGLIWYGIVDLVYCVIAFLLDFLALWGFTRRHIGRTLALTYSLRAWKLTGFLLSFAVFMFIIYSTQMWLASAVIFWLGLILSFVIAIFLGTAILELVHKVKISKTLFFTLTLTEFVAYAATIYVVIVLFTLAPK